MGVLAAPSTISGRGPAGTWLAGLVACVVVVNLAMSLQQLQSARTVAMWGAYLFVFIYCAGLEPGSAELKPRDGGPTTGSQDQRVLLGSVALAGTLLAAHGLYQSLYAFGRLGAIAVDQGFPEAVRARIESGRAVATLGLPDALSGLLAMSLPITLWLAYSANRSLAGRCSFFAMCVVQAAGLVATWSAGGVASLAIAASAVIWWRGHAGRKIVGRRVAIAVVATGLVGAALLLGARLAGPHGESNPLALREGNWKVAVDIMKEHPILGAGAGCYGIAFPPHRAWGMNESQFVHNSYLQLFSEMGVPVGSLVALAAGLFAWWLLNGTRAGFLAVACLSFLIHNGADFTFYVPSVGLTFFCLAGLAVASGTMRAPRAPEIDLRGAGSSRIPRCIAALALAAFALLLTRADLGRAAARDAVVGKDLPRAMSLAAAAVSHNPFDPESRSMLSHLLLDQATASRDPELLREAERQAQAAVDLDRVTPHHWNHLGRVLLARGDPQGAYVALARAAQLYPIKIEYRQDRDAVGAALAQKAPGPVASP